MKDCFKNHVATLHDYGDIKVVNWQNKNGSNEYRIRYVFDEPLCTMTVSGDCGVLVAQNYDNMVLGKMHDFLGETDLDYFVSKIKACQYGPYRFRYQNALRDAKEFLQSRVSDEALLDNTLRTVKEAGFSTITGFAVTEDCASVLREIDPQFYEWIGSCGKEVDTSIILILDGLKEALSQLGI